MFYKKKPVIIEAIQFWYNTDIIKQLMEFCGDALIASGKHRHPDAIGWLEIGTLEDGNPETAQVKHIATEGDWIIKGVHGEFYAVKMTYSRRHMNSMPHTLTGKVRFGTIRIPHVFSDDEEYICMEIQVFVPNGPDDWQGIPTYMSHYKWIKATPMDMIKLSVMKVEWVNG